MTYAAPTSQKTVDISAQFSYTIYKELGQAHKKQTNERERQQPEYKTGRVPR